MSPDTSIFENRGQEKPKKEPETSCDFGNGGGRGHSCPKTPSAADKFIDAYQNHGCNAWPPRVHTRAGFGDPAKLEGGEPTSECRISVEKGIIESRIGVERFIIREIR